MLEKKFQSNLIKQLKIMFPGCIVMKTDPTYMQGIPDLIILWGERWAALECKQTSNSHHQPNQDYYIRNMNDMGFARFISPENDLEVLEELNRYFSPDDYI